MKKLRGSGQNCFSNTQLREYYEEYETCRYCGESGADCFDHVEPRANKYTNSIFNASPVHNQKCNIAKHGEMHSHENKVKLIYKNMKHLQNRNYIPNDTDTLFINEYKTAQEALAML
jgi:hypothetical protein